MTYDQKKALWADLLSSKDGKAILVLIDEEIAILTEQLIQKNDETVRSEIKALQKIRSTSKKWHAELDNSNKV